MTITMSSHLRKLLIFTAAASLLGWAVVAGAGPDSGEPGKPGPLDEDTELLLPETWQKPADLHQAAVDLNSRLAQAERRRLVPWRLAEQIHRSLIAGRQLADKIDVDARPAYYQALYFSALAAGYPNDALDAARKLTALNDQLGWNFASLFRAGMVSGQKKVCDEAIKHLERLMSHAQPEAFEPMKRDAAMVGLSLDCPMPLLDGTTVNPAKCAGQVLVIDLFIYNNKASQAAMPMVRLAWETFKDYPNFRMVSVNMNRRESKASVLAYIKAQQIDWPVFIEAAQGQPTADRLLAAWKDRPQLYPTEIVVAPNGKVIFSGMPNDPVFHYAIRAGLVQANKGQIPTSQPDSATMRQPPPDAGDSTATPPTAQPGQTPRSTAAEKAEREKQAGQKLRLAEAFLAAGARENAARLYQEVLRDYPETDAALAAQAQLIILER